MISAGLYNRYDNSPGSSHNIMLGLIPRGSRVLEFGCAAGCMSREMKRRLECEVTGVEINPEAAQAAKRWCKRVIVESASTLDFQKHFGDEKFDVILFADVLEHLFNPWKMVGRVKSILSKGGAVVSSIPNIAHGMMRLGLMGGVFDYSQTGMLDQTHIRFFTLKSMLRMYEDAGYFVSRIFANRADFFGYEIEIPELPQEFVQWVSKQPGAYDYQYQIRAVPMEEKEAELQRKDYPGAVSKLDDVKLGLEWMKESVREITRFVPPDGHFVLIDKGHWKLFVDWGARVAHPFPEGDRFEQEPENDSQAIEELKMHEERGNANVVVLAWPAYEWPYIFDEFGEYLNARYDTVLENDRIRILRRK